MKRRTKFTATVLALNLLLTALPDAFLGSLGAHAEGDHWEVLYDTTAFPSGLLVTVYDSAGYHGSFEALSIYQGTEDENNLDDYWMAEPQTVDEQTAALVTKETTDTLFLADMAYYAAVTDLATNTSTLLSLGTGAPEILTVTAALFSGAAELSATVGGMPDATELSAIMMQLYASGKTTEEIEQAIAELYASYGPTGDVTVYAQIAGDVYVPLPYRTEPTAPRYTAGNYLVSYATNNNTAMLNDANAGTQWLVTEPVTFAGAPVALDFSNVPVTYADRVGTLTVSSETDTHGVLVTEETDEEEDGPVAMDYLQLMIPVTAGTFASVCFLNATEDGNYLLHTTPFAGNPITQVMFRHTLADASNAVCCAALLEKCEPVALTAGAAATWTLPTVDNSWDSTIAFVDASGKQPVELPVEQGTILRMQHRIVREDARLLLLMNSNLSDTSTLEQHTLTIADSTQVCSMPNSTAFVANADCAVSASYDFTLSNIQGTLSEPLEYWHYGAEGQLQLAGTTTTTSMDTQATSTTTDTTAPTELQCSLRFALAETCLNTPPINATLRLYNEAGIYVGSRVLPTITDGMTYAFETARDAVTAELVVPKAEEDLTLVVEPQRFALQADTETAVQITANAFVPKQAATLAVFYADDPVVAEGQQYGVNLPVVLEHTEDGTRYETLWHHLTAQLDTTDIPDGSYRILSNDKNVFADDCTLLLTEERTPAIGAKPDATLSIRQAEAIALTLSLKAGTMPIQPIGYTLLGYTADGKPIDLTADTMVQNVGVEQFQYSYAIVFRGGQYANAALDPSKGLTLQYGTQALASLSLTSTEGAASTEAAELCVLPDTVDITAKNATIHGSYTTQSNGYPTFHCIQMEAPIAVTRCPLLNVNLTVSGDDGQQDVLFVLRSETDGSIRTERRVAPVGDVRQFALEGYQPDDYTLYCCPETADGSVLAQLRANGYTTFPTGTETLSLTQTAEGTTCEVKLAQTTTARVQSASLLSLSRYALLTGDLLTATLTVDDILRADCKTGDLLTLTASEGWCDEATVLPQCALFLDGNALVVTPEMDGQCIQIALPACKAGAHLTGTVKVSYRVTAKAGSTAAITVAHQDATLCTSATVTAFSHNLPRAIGTVMPVLRGRAPSGGELLVMVDGVLCGRYAISPYGYWGFGADGDLAFSIPEQHGSTATVQFCYAEGDTVTPLETTVLQCNLQSATVAPQQYCLSYVDDTTVHQTKTVSSFTELNDYTLVLGPKYMKKELSLSMQFAPEDQYRVSNVILSIGKTNARLTLPFSDLGGGAYTITFSAGDFGALSIGYDVLPTLPDAPVYQTTALSEELAAYAKQTQRTEAEVWEMLAEELEHLQTSGTATTSLTDTAPYEYTDEESGLTAKGTFTLQRTYSDKRLETTADSQAAAATEDTAYQLLLPDHPLLAGTPLCSYYVSAPMVTVTPTGEADTYDLSIQYTMEIVCDLSYDAPTRAGTTGQEQKGTLLSRTVDVVEKVSSYKGKFDTANNVLGGTVLSITGEVKNISVPAPLGKALGAVGKVANVTGTIKNIGTNQFQGSMDMFSDSQKQLRSMRAFALAPAYATNNQEAIDRINAIYEEGMAAFEAKKKSTSMHDAINDTIDFAQIFVPKTLTGTTVNVVVDGTQDLANSVAESGRWSDNRDMLLDYQNRMNAVADSCRPVPKKPEEESHWDVGTIDRPPVPIRDEVIEAEPKYVMDPSGIVYEGMTTNPLQDVSCEIQYLDAEGNWQSWTQSVQYNFQQTILQTNDNGYYGWDVPEGKWRVAYHKEGYCGGKTVYSDAMDVPPIWLNVNQNLVADDATAKMTYTTDANGITLFFDKPVLAEPLLASIRTDLPFRFSYTGEVNACYADGVPTGETALLLMELRIELGASSTGGVYPVTVGDFTSYGGVTGKGVSIDFTASASGLPISGDINGDGVLTMADVVLFCRALTEDQTVDPAEIVWENAECDNIAGLLTLNDLFNLLNQNSMPVQALGKGTAANAPTIANSTNSVSGSTSPNK